MKSSVGFRLRTAFVLLIACAFLLGTWLWLCRSAIQVSAASEERLPVDRVFGHTTLTTYLSDAKLTSTRTTARHVFTAKGTFTPRRTLHADLYLVRSGTSQEANGLGVGVTESVILSTLGCKLEIKFALVEAETPAGRIVVLGTVGHHAGAGSGGLAFPSQGLPHRQVASGRLAGGAPRIVYVEGDRPPILTRSMSVAEFSKQNDGEYLVVALKFE